MVKSFISFFFVSLSTITDYIYLKIFIVIFQFQLLFIVYIYYIVYIMYISIDNLSIYTTR